ncbi:hypothetical protein OUZ56_017424 [Daphnia magna]|uniref:Uncharacterized protein n=1 Tax=Daphnia magna TaxID=35525 RepID=A0ABR0ASS1_9CRUS|nr:hypothetical protein OUZ56_017424 [Daphnia magna]
MASVEIKAEKFCTTTKYKYNIESRNLLQTPKKIMFVQRSLTKRYPNGYQSRVANLAIAFSVGASVSF